MLLWTRTLGHSKLRSVRQQFEQLYKAQFMHNGFPHFLQRWTVLLEMHWRHRSLPPTEVGTGWIWIWVNLMFPLSSSSPPHSSAPSIFRNCLRLARTLPVFSHQTTNELYAVTSIVFWKTLYGQLVVRFRMVYAPHIWSRWSTPPLLLLCAMMISGLLVSASMSPCKCSLNMRITRLFFFGAYETNVASTLNPNMDEPASLFLAVNSFGSSRRFFLTVPIRPKLRPRISRTSWRDVKKLSVTIRFFLHPTVQWDLTPPFSPVPWFVLHRYRFRDRAVYGGNKLS